MYPALQLLDWEAACVGNCLKAEAKHGVLLPSRTKAGVTPEEGTQGTVGVQGAGKGEEQVRVQEGT